jgi:hypothetical protein
MPRAREGSVTAWLWGVVLGWLVFGLLVGIGFVTGSWGYFVVTGAPIATGITLGRWVRTSHGGQVVLACAVLGAVITTAVTLNLAGAVCGFVFGSIVALPMMLGIWLGSTLAGNVRPATWAASIAFVGLLIPLEQAALPSQPIETVATTHVLEMSAGDAFERIQFYEDASGTPPRLLQFALPRPIKTVGDGSRVGGIQRCIYDIGYLVKEITEVEPGERYAFRVIEQVGVEDHSVALTTGSFDFEPIDEDTTEVVLTTSYRPKLSARLAWRPFEHAVIHKLHDHVIASMTRGTNR